MRIVILKHERQKQPLRDHYTLGAMAEAWKEQGLEVIEVRGPRKRVAADLAIAHIDLTIDPPAYVEFMRQYPVTVNGALNDISKRTISMLQLRRDTPWEGRVIVKTDLNCLGSGEIQLAGKTRPGDPWRFVPLAISKRLRPRIEPLMARLTEYRLFDSPAEIPAGWWNDEALVIEKFVPEHDGESYLVRRCAFFGDRLMNRVFRSHAPIARGLDLFDAREVEPPAGIHSLRQSLAIDFGRIDYALVEDRIVLYDVNKTPTIRMNAENLQRARTLAAGIDFYLSRPAP